MRGQSITGGGRESMSSLVRWSRLATVATAWLFAAAVVVQVFLAGASIFDPANPRWTDHRTVGEMIGTLTIFLVIFAVVGRLPLLQIGMAVAIFFLYGFQWMFANLDNGSVAALHAVNALALFWLSVELGKRAMVVHRGMGR